LSSRSSSSCADIDFAVLFLTAHLAEFTPGVSSQKQGPGVVDLCLV
jgi:hypothetical protein